MKSGAKMLAVLCCMGVIFGCFNERGSDLTSPKTLPASENQDVTVREKLIAASKGLQKPHTEWTNLLAYSVPGMEDVVVKNRPYKPLGMEIQALPPATRHDRATDGPLTFDIYYPPSMRGNERSPVVVLVVGFHDEIMRSWFGVPLKDHGLYTSWARLIAASGMIAVSYQTTEPDDLVRFIEYIRQQSDALKIDPNSIGLWAMSACPVMASSYAFQSDREFIKFGVFTYGQIWTPDNYSVGLIREDAAALGYWFEDLPEPTVWRTDMPILLVRCFKDAEVVHETVDYFYEVGVRDHNMDITMIRYDQGYDEEYGAHGFDYLQDTQRSAEIIAEEVAFMIEHAF